MNKTKSPKKSKLVNHLNKMILKNPNLKIFIDKLDLKIVLENGKGK